MTGDEARLKAEPQPRTARRSTYLPESRVRGFRPDIEGLRAVAILLVVAYHAGVPGFSGGFIGVDVFFVLSGYLITGLLLREIAETGRLDLPRFYARRARRLLPAAALMVLVTLVIGRLVVSPLEMKRLSATSVATSAYASNLYFIRQATNYMAAATGENPLLHTWSLAVEEQFYLAWPLLILGGFLLARRAKAANRLVLVLAGVAIVSFAANLYLTRRIQPWAFFGSPFRAWEFAAGGLAAMFPAAARGRDVLYRALGWSGLALVITASVRFGDSTPFPGAAALLPIAGTVLVLAACAPAPGAGVGRLLGLAFMQRIGKLSYSWYLWHWPVLVYARILGLATPLWARLACALISLGLAAAAFHWVEDPIRHHRSLVRRPGLTIALAACLTLLCFGLSGVARVESVRVLKRPEQVVFARTAETESAPEGCQLGYLASTGRTCEFGDTTASTTAVLFGDSHATQWLPALDGLGRARGWRIRLVSKSGCPPGSVDVRSPALNREYIECSAWRRTMLSRIAEWRPDIVFLTASFSYSIRPDTFGVTPEQWREGLRRTLETLHRPGTRLVLLRDTPRPWFDVPDCLSRAAFAPVKLHRDCSVDRNIAVDTTVFAFELEAAAAFPDVVILDLTDALCGPRTCEPIIDGNIVYKDSNHMGTAFSASLSGQLAAAFDAATAAGDSMTITQP